MGKQVVVRLDDKTENMLLSLMKISGENSTNIVKNSIAYLYYLTNPKIKMSDLIKSGIFSIIQASPEKLKELNFTEIIKSVRELELEYAEN